MTEEEYVGWSRYNRRSGGSIIQKLVPVPGASYNSQIISYRAAVRVPELARGLAFPALEGAVKRARLRIAEQEGGPHSPKAPRRAGSCVQGPCARESRLGEVVPLRLEVALQRALAERHPARDLGLSGLARGERRAELTPHARGERRGVGEGLGEREREDRGTRRAPDRGRPPVVRARLARAPDESPARRSAGTSKDLVVNRAIAWGRMLKPDLERQRLTRRKLGQLSQQNDRRSRRVLREHPSASDALLEHSVNHRSIRFVFDHGNVRIAEQVP